MNTRVYRYGARPPTENAALVDEQLLAGHRYRNALVEIERERLVALRTFRDADPRVVEAAAVVEGAPKGAAKREARARLREARAVVVAEQKPARDAIHERAAARRREARATTEAYWGTYLLAEQAVDAAAEKCRKLGGDTLPHFRRWDGAGRIGVQIQGGLLIETAWGGTDTRVRLVRLPDPKGMTAGSRRAGHRVELQIRVGTVTGKRDPIWASIPFTMHREVPPGNTIKWVVVRRDRIGPDSRWSVQFTAEGPAHNDPRVDAARAGVVAVDLGWRVRPDGVRVGYWRDTAGRGGEIFASDRLRDALAFLRSLIGIRTRLAEEFRDRLVVWRLQHTEQLPEWFATETETLGQWRSPLRLAALVGRWARERFEGDAEFFETQPTCDRDRNGALDCVEHVECWRRKNQHLYRWAAHGTAKVLGRRDEHYRLVAVDLARRYAAVVVEDFNLHDVAGRRTLKDDATDGEKATADNSSAVRHVVAPGTFRAALKNAYAARGGRFVVGPCAWTTITCHACGHTEGFDAAGELWRDCPVCGAVWDQDDNACRNLLAWYAASGPAADDPPEALAGGMSARQQRFRAKKAARHTQPDDGVDHRSNLSGEVIGSASVFADAVATPAQGNRT